MKIARSLVLGLLGIFLILAFCDHFGIGSLTCGEGCSAATSGWFGSFVLVLGAVAQGGLVYLLVTNKDHEFKIFSGICAAGGVALIGLMIFSFHSVCQTCAGFDVTMLILWVSNWWSGKAKFALIPTALILSVLPGIVLFERFAPKSAAANESPDIARYEGETLDPMRTNLIVFADPNCLHCRKLVEKLLANNKQYQVFDRWVVFEPPMESGRRVAAIIAALQSRGDRFATPLLRDLSSSQGEFTDHQLVTFAENIGISEKMKAMLVNLPQDGVNRLMEDAKSASQCRITKVPAVYLILGEGGSGKGWNIVPDDQVVSE